MDLKKPLLALTAGLMVAGASSQALALTLSSGEITFEIENFENFIPGWGADPAQPIGAPPAGNFGDGVEDLRGLVNVTGITQLATSDSFEPIAGSLVKSIADESLTGILYGFDSEYLTGSVLTSSPFFGFTGGFLDLYLDPTADETVAAGPSDFGGAGCTVAGSSLCYPTIGDGDIADPQLWLRLAFAVGQDTGGTGLLGPNTGATLYGNVSATGTGTVSPAGNSTLFITGSSSGFMNVIGGSAMAAFDNNAVPIGFTGTTAAGFADFSFSNNFGSECLDVVLLTHVDGCGNPQFSTVGYDGLAPNGSGLWDTLSLGPAVSRVPEPATLGLLGLGLLGLVAARKQQRSA